MITTFTGPMHADKSKRMIDKYDEIFNKEHVLVFKSSLDTRDGDAIKSHAKGYENKEVKAVYISSFDEIKSYVSDNIRAIFIDEVELITEGNVNILLDLSIYNDIDIYLSGLNQTSEQEPFGMMPTILALSDVVVNVKASCYDCGREATFTYHEGTKDGTVLVGDSGYYPLCGKCLAKRRLNEKKKKNKKSSNSRQMSLSLFDNNDII